MDELSDLPPMRTPTSNRPLLGMTVLVVEDSRFTCEALRLMCLRSGARIRRADCLRSARRHLRVYRPSIAIVDLGLPDGSGTDLIEDLNSANPRVGVIMATSGDDSLKDSAMAAGADGFLSKPLSSVGEFQQAILEKLPIDRRPSGPRVLSEDVIDPDPMAYRDDMSHVANLLDDHQEGPVLDYVVQFLSGVARSAEDRPLVEATSDLEGSLSDKTARTDKIARLAGLVQDRLNDRIAI
ncbi:MULTISPECIES: response regulator [unclassified Roseovarius]|uniref:response regulator n=1 Tax=unclassified Roseovarius TaxID=2614913 RepID=UPI00273D54B1|nr:MULTISPECIES: response regulator [unclassified Roseovarius]